jgi:hypothetical protein
MNPYLNTSDIHTLSAAAAQERVDILEQQALDIESNLKVAQAKHFSTGEYADPVWYQKASGGLKRRRQIISMLQRHIKSLKTVTASGESVRFERCFMQVAKRLLKPESYDMLVEEARGMADGD